MARAILPQPVPEAQHTNECPVCMEDMAGEQVVRPPCGHELCHPCCRRIQGLNNLCPLCRARYPPRLAPQPIPAPIVPIRPQQTVEDMLIYAFGDFCRYHQHLPIGVKRMAEEAIRRSIQRVQEADNLTGELLLALFATSALSLPPPPPADVSRRRCPGCRRTKPGVRLVSIQGLARRVNRCQDCHR